MLIIAKNKPFANWYGLFSFAGICKPKLSDDMSNKVQCPKCRHEINIEAVLAERIANEQNAKLAARLQELKTRELSLTRQQGDLKNELATQLEVCLTQEKAKLTQQLKSAIQAEKEIEFQSLQTELNEKSLQVTELRKKEGDILRQVRQLEESRAGLDAEVETRLAAEREHIATQLRSQLETENSLNLKTKDILIGQLRERVNDMQRKVEQGSMQAQGEAQELVLEDVLRATHPFDLLEEIGKGECGADLMQYVRNPAGQNCGSILYESKNTKAFSDDWVTKLKADMLLKKADLGMIVTRTLPKGVSCFQQVEPNIWICSQEHFKHLTFALRAALLRVNDVRVVQTNQGEKSQILYNYVTGSEFKGNLKGIHDACDEIRKSLHDEEKVFLGRLKKRDQLLNRLLLNVLSIGGSVNGISGQTVAEFAEFEVVDEEPALLE